MIKEWEDLTERITENWIREYFDVEKDEDIYFWWMNNEVGGIFEFADHYFNFSDVLNCYNHNISKDQLFRWYNYCMENPSTAISLTRFILNPAEKAEKERKHLEELSERVVLSEREFKEALKNYGK